MANDGVDGNGCRRGRDGRTGRSRRRFLALAGSTAGAVALAGCGGRSGTSGTPTKYWDSEWGGGKRTYAASDLYNIEDWRGSGPLVQDRPDEYEGISVLDLPDLRGELTVYLGGGEGGTYVNLLKRLQNLYRDFTVIVRRASSSQLANTIVEETTANQSPADVFWAIDAGSVGIVSDRGAAALLPEFVVSEVPDVYHPTSQWVGVMGRARSIPYNTNELDASDVPDSVMAFPDEPTFQDAMGWAPSYGAFQSFVTAMRVLEGDSATRQWLEGMQAQGIGTYGNEFAVANRVADGELTAGFSNHYYSRLVREERPDAPIELAFTKNDAGALVNCAGAQVLRGSQNKQVAAQLIHHLLSIEAQEYLATRSYGYPLVPSVPPVGNLPTIDQLNPPQFDLGRLSDVEPTLQMLREVGAL
jgi:iron(III) transport system substrate-binding protein